MQEWLADDHLAHFVVTTINGLDVSTQEASYSGGGSPPYPPKMMLALLFYGYSTGIFSCRKLEQTTYELIPVIYITGNTHPNHNSINTFRKRFLGEMKDLFTQILLRAYANRLEEQHSGVRAEVDELLKKAEEAGDAEAVAGIKVGEEVALRQA